MDKATTVVWRELRRQLRFVRHGGYDNNGEGTKRHYLWGYARGAKEAAPENAGITRLANKAEVLAIKYGWNY